MKQVRGFWLPEKEQHLVPFLENSPEFAGGPTYQFDKFARAFPFIKNFAHAVDVGAHCGLWSRVMVRCFTKVSAFEPIPEHIACFKANVPEADLYPFALADTFGMVAMRTGVESTGDTAVCPDGTFATRVIALDNAGLKKIDFLKIDCEGFEKFILEGGEFQVQNDKPCIVVEQKKGMGSKYGLSDTAAIDLLVSWGAVQRFVMSGDYCMSWD